jgi:hypothetical protein
MSNEWIMLLFGIGMGMFIGYMLFVIILDKR